MTIIYTNVNVYWKITDCTRYYDYDCLISPKAIFIITVLTLSSPALFPRVVSRLNSSLSLCTCTPHNNRFSNKCTMRKIYVRSARLSDPRCQSSITCSTSLNRRNHLQEKLSRIIYAPSSYPFSSSSSTLSQPYHAATSLCHEYHLAIVSIIIIRQKSVDQESCELILTR